MTSRERELLRQQVGQAKRDLVKPGMPWSELGRTSRKVHSDKTRAQAGRLYLGGTGVNEIARLLEVPRTTVSFWIANRPWQFTQTTATGPEVLDGLVGASRRTECTA